GLESCRIQEGEQTKFSLYDKDGEQICPCKFVQNYSTPYMIRYFSESIFCSSDNKIDADIANLSIHTEGICEKLSNGARFDDFDDFNLPSKEESQQTPDSKEKLDRDQPTNSDAELQTSIHHLNILHQYQILRQAQTPPGDTPADDSLLQQSTDVTSPSCIQQQPTQEAQVPNLTSSSEPSSTTTNPIVSVESFFEDKQSWPLPHHSFEQSPCHAIIDS